MDSAIPGIARAISAKRAGRSRSTPMTTPVQRLPSSANTEVSAASHRIAVDVRVSSSTHPSYLLADVVASDLSFTSSWRNPLVGDHGGSHTRLNTVATNGEGALG